MLDRLASLLCIKKPAYGEGVLWASGATVPGAVRGYRTGCIFQHTDGGAGTSLYVNEGSVTSASFKPITGLTAGAAEVKVYVDPNGSDTAGAGSAIAPVATVTKALTLVTATRRVIVLAPGDYAEAATLVWPTVNGVALISSGGSQVTTVSVPVAGQTSVITVTPGVQTSSFYGLIQGVEIDHSGVHPTHAQSGITFDNTGMTKKLNFSIKNCTGSCDAGTDKWVNVATHADADNAICIYISGDGVQSEVEGAINFVVNNNADRLHLEQVWIDGTITTSATALEFRMRLYRCILPAGAATAGGNGLQYITSVNSYVWTDYDDLTPETYVALATGDLAGSHSEVIVA